MYMFIVCLALCVLCGIMVVVHAKERQRLTELLAAKDYTEYKSFEEGEPKENHSNMFTKRENEKKKRLERG